MDGKVVLVLVDGMRPDGIEQASHTFLADTRKKGTTCFRSRTVMPSVTLPCHASLFFSVDAGRHGITTNTWSPMVRPIDSIGDCVCKAQKKAAMFYNWEELRDLNRPGSLNYSHYQTGELPLEEALEGERSMTGLAISYLEKEHPDFLFLYLGCADVAGHRHGWMGKEYMETISNASRCIETLYNSLPEEYSLIVTADHGGHDRSHGTELQEDMVIPAIFCGAPFEAGKELESVSIKDIAPTIARVVGFPVPPEWEGKSVL